MENIDYGELLKKMLDAAKGKLTTHWKEVKPYAENEFKKFNQNIKLIAKLKLEGKIDAEKAVLHLKIQKNAMQIVFLTVEGLGLLAVEAAINAVIDVIKVTVNKAIGWDIL